MDTSATEKGNGQLWGISYTVREYARPLGDPLRKVIEAHQDWTAIAVFLFVANLKKRRRMSVCL